ncbi:ribF: riboflavin biosynthesis protein RibF [Rubrobacter radiotolerans]|uniref:Riboflavin biosynthesis protein n=1 Tax=Rubrobacter radiotolerans TaxID=42256 RepID=A0A023X3S6_RUBRA|nr:bifunctional riboflavin kinase/FAD synthetase [Rubrobacter radiotolerans]AHY46704.1 ribF: riboflavin biosynthesis protein RibF [Rubrobacter radiotolerans]MDX5894111.1 bifunctional riboflavin kinase/FAD synthetase [Rubrobacter radiotolerans]SMC05235.1 riboflavin kinase / FMN adenylyltransferase [Rubrobacter radiotolerans DSM 5868]
MRGVAEAGKGRSVALGNFDGVHLGHRSVLERAREEGRKRGLQAVAATFDPHPRAILRPESAPKLLTDIETRRRLLLEAGMDDVVVVPFDRDLSTETPEEFVLSVLVGKLRAQVVVVGENFRFGYRASGDLSDLRRIMRQRGGEAFGVGVRREDEEEISSTRIREALLGGRVAEASRLLGRPYEVPGHVVPGDRRGRTIGFPTANVLPPKDLLVPARGVYACCVTLGGEVYPACVNVGVAPTFGERESRIEAHLLDFEGDIYGEKVSVEFVERIRKEKRFGDVEELVAQIRRDVEEAGEILR